MRLKRTTRMWKQDVFVVVVLIKRMQSVSPTSGHIEKRLANELWDPSQQLQSAFPGLEIAPVRMRHCEV